MLEPDHEINLVKLRKRRRTFWLAFPFLDPRGKRV
jgi:hypothetical protein